MDMIANMKKMLDDGRDDLLLRFGLGQALFKAGEFDEAIIHLSRAIEHEPGHSAAWKMLGKSYASSGDDEQAISTYQQGIKVAEENGDIQAVKEMQVFLKRSVKNNQPD
jgi:tetratricopeptide (TPR) repeat protein